MARRMPDWLELQDDLLAFVARCLNLIEDYSSFRTVCKSWHSAATKNNFNSDLPRVPWLMLAEEEDNTDGSYCRKLFSLYNGMILKKKIPKASRQKCMESIDPVLEDGGVMRRIPDKHYINGSIDYIDYINVNTLNLQEFKIIAEICGYAPDSITFWYKCGKYGRRWRLISTDFEAYAVSKSLRKEDMKEIYFEHDT